MAQTDNSLTDKSKAYCHIMEPKEFSWMRSKNTPNCIFDKKYGLDAKYLPREVVSNKR